MRAFRIVVHGGDGRCIPASSSRRKTGKCARHADGRQEPDESLDRIGGDACATKPGRVGVQQRLAVAPRRVDAGEDIVEETIGHERAHDLPLCHHGQCPRAQPAPRRIRPLHSWVLEVERQRT